MAGDPAELAYGHCLAVLGDPARASEVAAAALRRAGRTRSLVLAHARHQALLAWDDGTWPDPSVAPASMADPASAAHALAFTRPAVERAVIDLRNRTGVDRAALGRALGTSPTVAVQRAAEIAEVWERELDPAMLALLGPGDCPELAAVLGELTLETVADLLAAGPAVSAHAAECESCGDRLRAIASVGSLLGRDAVHVPDEVRLAGRVSRRRRSSATPPPLLGPTPAARARRGIPIAAAVAAALVASAVALAAWPDKKEASRVQALKKLPASASLTLGQPATTGETTIVSLHNNRDDSITWTAEVSVAWAEAVPARGSVDGNGLTRVVVRRLDTAPEGDVRAKLTVTASDGSTAATELVWTVERPPQIAANATGCDIKVNVVEDGELSSLMLHWRDTAEHEAPITEGPDGYTTTLSPAPVAQTWWITATDARGNSSRSSDAVIPPGTC